MTDMLKNTPDTQPAAQEVVDTSISTEAQPDDTSTAEAEAVLSSIPLDKHEELIASRVTKARADEKAKMHKKLSAMEVAAEDSRTEREKEATALKDALDKLSLLEDSKLSDADKVQKQLDKLADQNTRLQAQLEEVATKATERIRASELAAFRDRSLRESGITLTELVTGNTQEEITASIATAMDREAAIYDRASETIRKELAGNVPTPITQTQVPSNTQPLVASMDKRRIAKMDKGEYARICA
jgi:primosomal protein N'